MFSVVTFFDFDLTGRLPVCYYKLLGLHCFGCGGTRALQYFMRGNIRAAMYYNPFVILSVIAAVLFLLYIFIRALRKNFKPLGTKLLMRMLWIISITVIVATVFRNLEIYQRFFY